MTRIETRKLENFISTLDEMIEADHISIAEYTQIGLLLKILETLDRIKLEIQAYSQRGQN